MRCPVLSRFNMTLLLTLLLLCASGGVGAATALPLPAGAAASTPAKPEVLVQGGLLGTLSSSIDDAQNQLDLNGHLLDAWRLRADRAADEMDQLVSQTRERSPWGVAGDFLSLSVAWLA